MSRRSSRRTIAAGCALLVALPLGVGLAHADDPPVPEWPTVKERGGSGSSSEPSVVDWPEPKQL